MNDIQITDFAVSSAFDLSNFIFLLIGAALTGTILSWHYSRFFPHISRSQSMGKTLFGISVVTFLIISVVKSSLALSLGLVGALSIIRFRTPIKEPFELAYLFMAIAIGLGFGANQATPTVIVILFILISLRFVSENFLRKDEGGFYIYLNFNKVLSPNAVRDNLNKIIFNTSYTIDLKRLDSSEKGSQITLLTNFPSKEELLNFQKLVDEIFSPESISIVDGQKITPF